MGILAGTMIWDASDANPMHRRLPAEVHGWDEDKMIRKSLVVFNGETNG